MKLSKISMLLMTLSLAFTSGQGFAQEKKKKKKKKVKETTEETTTTEGAAKADGSAKNSDGAMASEGGGYKVGYGMAGCGLGSLVFKTNSKGPQIGAWFLNTLGYQCSVISSTKGSNCESGPDLKTAEVEQEVFMNVNIAEISRDAALGGGEFLDAFADVLGCEGLVTRSAFAKMSQSQYDLLFASQEPRVVLRNFVNAVQRDQILKDACSRAAITAHSFASIQ